MVISKHKPGVVKARPSVRIHKHRLVVIMIQFSPGVAITTYQVCELNKRKTG